MAAPSPDEISACNATWRWWAELLRPDHAALRETVLPIESPDPAMIEKLRRHHDPQLVTVALQWAQAQRRVARKFGERSIIADRTGLEMASAYEVAEHKARRFFQVMPEHATLIDAGCGIGGDLLAFTDQAAGRRVYGIDRDPMRAWMARRNANVPTLAADIEHVLRPIALNCDGRSESEQLTELYLHVDPSRRDERSGRRRLREVEALAPTWSWIEQMRHRVAGGCVKLGPGVDIEGLPGDVSWQWVQRGGALVELRMWFGRLAGEPALREVVMLPGGHTFSGHADVAMDYDTSGAFLFEPEPGIERAGLLGALAAQHGLRGIIPGLGLLVADDAVDSPWVRSFRVLHRMAWREADCRRWLAENDASIVEVKVRGGVVDPDVIAPRLRGAGARVMTVFIFRIGRAAKAWITERIA